ncbi:hypothetical protein SASPL_145607 [Salvia splendens]|uniref:Uncharacterized protein n=1 Tax=Salvia splendens TaxID=180675 RepID=A0A8X8WHX2_SALSN|nr:hypothetical protein SASPL_145607 [Salvia splendens]
MSGRSRSRPERPTPRARSGTQGGAVAVGAGVQGCCSCAAVFSLFLARGSLSAGGGKAVGAAILPCLALYSWQVFLVFIKGRLPLSLHCGFVALAGGPFDSAHNTCDFPWVRRTSG